MINFGIAIALSQFLGPDGKGVQSLIITTITFVLVFANLVGGATLVYLVPRHSPSVLIIPSVIWTLFVGGVAYAVLMLFPVVDTSYALHICILAGLNSFTSINSSILIGKEKINPSNIVGLIQPLVLILSLLSFFWFSDQPRVDHYIWSLYISFSAAVIVSIAYYFRFCGKIVIHSLKEYISVSIEMLRFGFPNQVAHITQMLSFRLSFYVLDNFHGEAAVGVYSNGISIAESIWLIAKSISLVQYARIANLDSRKEAATLTVRLMKFSLTSSLILLLPVLLFPSSFFIWLFGNGFGDTRFVIQALAIGVLIYNFSILAGHYFSGTGRYHINALTSSAGLIVSVILYYTMIPRFGITGAGWATSLSYLVTTVILMFLFGRENKGWYKNLAVEKTDLDRIKVLFRSYFRSSPKN